MLYIFIFVLFLEKKYTKGKTSSNCHFIQCRRKFKIRVTNAALQQPKY